MVDGAVDAVWVGAVDGVDGVDGVDANDAAGDDRRGESGINADDGRMMGHQDPGQRERQRAQKCQETSRKIEDDRADDCQ